MNKKGQTLVEFVLVIPVFLLIILFIMQIFFVMHSQQKLLMAESFIVNVKIVNNPQGINIFYDENKILNYVKNNFFRTTDSITLTYKPEDTFVFGEDSIFSAFLQCKQTYMYKDLTFSLIQGIFKTVDGKLLTQTEVSLNT